MLAIASLATGFVVAAVTPSQAGGEEPGKVDDTLSTLDRTGVTDGPTLDDRTPGGQEN